MNKLLRAFEVGERLGMAEPQVFRLARENILPCVRVGRSVRFDSDVIEEWIRAGGKAWDGGWRKEA
jgi:excisionase family DNA binding protein